MSGDIIYLSRTSTREPINIDSTPCADQIDQLRSALPLHQLYIDADTRRPVRVDTSTGSLQVVPIDQAAMTEIAARAYDWIRPGKSGPKQVAPPTAVVRAVLANPGDLPRLRRVHDTPYLAPSGRVVCEMGYDSATETYLHFDREIDPIPDRPSDERLAEAVQLIAHDALAGFVFADNASRANAIASVITYYLRQLYPDLLAPIHLFDAVDNNYGKTSLAQCLIAPLVGHSPEVTPMTATDRTECRRTIYSLLRSSPVANILDNLAETIAGDAIASVLTSRRTRDRQIKSSTAPSVTNDALWYVTGTLITTSRELGIRSVLTQLSAPPTGNRDPIAWAIDHRIEVVRAYLTILRRWIADGRMLDRTVKHPKYPRWSELVGGVLATMGIPDMLGNQQLLLATRDDESAAWRDLVDRWSSLQGGPSQRRRVGEIVDHACTPGEPAYDLVAEGRDQDSRKKILGHALRRRDGIAIGGWRIRAAENKNKKVHEYWLEPGAPTTGPTSPTSSTPMRPAPLRRGVPGAAVAPETAPTSPTSTSPVPQSVTQRESTPQDTNTPATNTADSTTDNAAGNGERCGVCGVSYPHDTPRTCARGHARESPAGSLIPAHPAAITTAIESWAATADQSVAADPASPLARAVERERRGGRS